MNSKDHELIALYEHFLKEMRDLAEEKIIVLDEVSDLFSSIKSIEKRLEELYKENNDDKIT